MIRQLRPALSFLILTSFLLGGAYPACVWFVGKIFFPKQSRGSLVYEKGRVIGSELIAQPFSSLRYFWPRPSATQPMPYQFLASGASNLNPANPEQIKRIHERAAALRHKHDNSTSDIPADLVTASGSGLDPHISPEAARYQAGRIAGERGQPLEAILALIDETIEPPTFGFLGEARINVLRLNMKLDRLSGGAR